MRYTGEVEGVGYRVQEKRAKRDRKGRGKSSAGPFYPSEGKGGGW